MPATRPGPRRAPAQSRLPFVAAVLLCACTGIVIGCVSGTMLRPSPTPPPSAAPAEVEPGPSVPKVLDPIDLSRAKKDLCGTLSTAQVFGLLGSDAQPQPGRFNALLPACFWYAGDDSIRSALSVKIPNWPPLDGRNFNSLWRAYNFREDYRFFTPLAPVDGHPVVAHSFSQDDLRPKTEACTVELGANDDETLTISIHLVHAKPTGADLCDSARTAAGMVLASLRR